ncbi:MAG: hypothetical protein K0S85_44 [Pseudomonas orientalis]|nr:hypothetical protein [Pseudomonas orientalis]
MPPDLTGTTQEQAPRLHYYALSFLDITPSGAPLNASTYVGWPEQMVTKPRIDAAKPSAGVGPGAVLLACSYLGEMTRAQMLGESHPTAHNEPKGPCHE